LPLLFNELLVEAGERCHHRRVLALRLEALTGLPVRQQLMFRDKPKTFRLRWRRPLGMAGGDGRREDPAIWGVWGWLWWRWGASVVVGGGGENEEAV
jgi:hypothetical protein